MNANLPEDPAAPERAVLGAASVLADAVCFHDPVAWEALCFHGLLHAGRVPGTLVGRHVAQLGPLVARAARECGGTAEAIPARLLRPLFEASFLQPLCGTVDYQIRPVVGQLVAQELDRRDWVVWCERAAAVREAELRAGAGGAAAARLRGHDSPALRALAREILPLPRVRGLFRSPEGGRKKRRKTQRKRGGTGVGREPNLCGTRGLHSLLFCVSLRSLRRFQFPLSAPRNIAGWTAGPRGNAALPPHGRDALPRVRGLSPRRTDRSRRRRDPPAPTDGERAGPCAGLTASTASAVVVEEVGNHAGREAHASRPVFLGRATHRLSAGTQRSGSEIGGGPVAFGSPALVGRVCPQRAAESYECPTGALRTDAPYPPYSSPI